MNIRAFTLLACQRDADGHLFAMTRVFLTRYLSWQAGALTRRSGGAALAEAETDCFHIEFVLQPVQHLIADRAVITQFD